MVPQPKYDFIRDNKAKSRELRPIVKYGCTVQPNFDLLFFVIDI